MDTLWKYLEKQVEEGVNGTVTWFPPEILKWIADVGLDVALDATEYATRPFTGRYFYEELRGMSEASGVSFQRLAQIHMIGELTKGACSMFGASHSATKTGSLLQLRALDWDTKGPFKDHPQLTVYHSNVSGQNTFANWGWTGWVGSITGMSDVPLGISEIGVAFPDDTFGEESRFGIPFTFILRDVLQFDSSLDDAITRITNAKRTCYLILGVGDGRKRANIEPAFPFRGIEYSSSVAKFFTPETMEPVNATWHPRMKDVVYYGMDWLCPGYNEKLHEQLQSVHGNLTAELAIQEVTAKVQTGNLHVAYYDYEVMRMYVATARKSSITTGPQYAYDRTFTRLDMNAIFSVSSP